MDELYQINYNLESQIERIGRYCTETYTHLKQQLKSNQLTVAQIKQIITEKNKEMEAYPRQNKNCIEFYTKYSEKYSDYCSKFQQQIKTENMIRELLEEFKEKKNRLFEQNFYTLR